MILGNDLNESRLVNFMNLQDSRISKEKNSSKFMILKRFTYLKRFTELKLLLILNLIITTYVVISGYTGIQDFMVTGSRIVGLARRRRFMRDLNPRRHV